LGRLGSALARGLNEAKWADKIYGYNRGAAKAHALAKQVPTLRLCASEAEVLQQGELVFLWTKPPDALGVLQANQDLIRGRRPLLVTCVIGVPLARFTDRWAECLPNVNMPARRGVTALHCAPALGASDRRLVCDVLRAVGAVYELPAEEIPFYSALCSCGPALYATMLEILADVLAARRGYDRALCRRMVRETVLGTVLLRELDGADATEVVRRVAHPGGPSEAGAAYLRSVLPALYEMMLQKMRKW
jgi:pyrroline-5-carboxylate reductase